MSDTSSGPDLLNDLAHEFAERYRHGEQPSLTEYVERHPELAEQIRELFPTLAVMEEFGSVQNANSERAANSRHVPERLGEYRILREVGRGGMGVVYEAVQESLGRHVALKVLPLRGAVPAKQRERFKREAKAAANLHHSNIVPVFGVGEAEGVHFYAMQFIPGQGLDVVLEEVRRLRAGALLSSTPDPNANVTASLAAGLVSGFELVRPSAPTDPAIHTRNTHAGSTSAVVGQSGESATGSDYYRRVAQIGLQVAEALEHAHAQGVLHRDVKPSNLLLDARGCVWVTDFGLAKLEGGEELTTPGDIVGTLRYMPPERFAGKEDTRGDLYGLGLTLYEMLALRPAFDAPDRPRLLELVRSGDVPRPRQSDPRVPRDLEMVVVKAAARDPRDRYQTATELAADLRRFLADRPVHARRVTWVEQGRRWCRRNRAVSSLAAGVLLSLLLAVVVLAVGNMRVREQKDETDKALTERNDALQTAGVNLTEANTQATIAKNNEQLAKNNETLAKENEKLARDNETLAKEQERLAWRRFYAAQMNLAQQAWDAGHLPRVLELLESQRPRFGQEDQRGFEWYYLWEQCHKRQRLSWSDRNANASAVALSPDGTLLASARLGLDGTVKVWSTTDGRERHLLRGHTRGVWCLAFSPDGKILASGSSDSTVRLWDLVSGQELATLACTQKDNGVRHVAFSPDGKTLAVSNCDNDSVKLWDLSTRKVIGIFKGHKGEVITVAFSPDGKTLASGGGSGDWCVKIWSWDGTTAQERFTIPARWGSQVQFSPDGNILAIGNVTVDLYDVATGTRRASLQGHGNNASSLAFSPDGKALASGGEDRTVRLWDLASGKELRQFSYQSSVHSVGFSADGKILAAGGVDGEIKLWDMGAVEAPDAIKHSGPVRSVVFSQDGRTLISAGDYPTKFWDVATCKEKAAVTGPMWALAISEDGKTLATRDPDKTITVRDLVTGQVRAKLKDEKATVGALSPDGTTFLTFLPEDGNTFKIWDTVTGRLRKACEAPGLSVMSVDFSPDGKLVATGLKFHDVCVWDTATGQQKFIIPQGESGLGMVMSVRFSPDGKTLAAGTGGTVRLWDVTGQQLLVSLKGHTRTVRSIAFSPDGRTLATASEDGTVKLWDPATGQERMTLGVEGITLMAFAADGNTLATVGADGTVKLWRGATSAEARGRKVHLDVNDPDSPLALNTRADHLWASGNVGAAEASYRRALVLLERATREYPDLDLARSERVRSAYTLSAFLPAVGRPDDVAPVRRQAEELFRQLPLEARSAVVEKLFTLGESLRLAGQAPAARHVYAIVTTIEPDQLRLGLVRGRAFLALGQHEHAVKEWAALLKDPTNTPHLLPVFILTQYRAGDYRGAIDTANDANRRGIGTVPSSPFVLALAHEKLGERDVARKWYKIGLVHLHRTASQDPERIGLRAEASKLLGLPEELTPAEQQFVADTGRFLTLIVQADPKASWVLRQRDLSTADKNKWEQWVIDRSRDIARDPTNPYPWHRRAVAYGQLGNWNFALADFDQASKLDPNDGGIWNQRGLVQVEGFGDLETAIRDFTRAIELLPAHADFWFNRGYVRKRLGRWEEAVADFDGAINLNPDYMHSWAERGGCNFQLGRYDRAVVDFTGAIKLEAKEYTLWQPRGASHYRLGEYDKALADITKAIELSPRIPNLLVERADINAHLGRRQEARADLDQALTFASPATAVTVYKELGYFLNDGFGSEHRDPKGAMDAARQMLKIAPKNGVAWSIIGRAQYHTGDYPAALESFTKATELRTDNGPHLVFRAMVHWKLGQPDEARRWYSQWARHIEQTRMKWETNRPMAEAHDRYRTEAMALWGAAVPEVAPLPRVVPTPKK